MKKIYFLLMSILLPLVSMADDNGSCGDNVTYTFVEETGTLTISGSGTMTDYNDYSSKAPWLSYKDKITKVIIEEGVTSVGAYAFGNPKDAYNLLVSVSLPNGLLSIGSYAFCGCSSLVSITIPSNVTSIGGCAFYGCSSILSLVIPEGVTSIAESTFYGCSGMMSISLPEGLTSIERYGFQGCSGLSEMNIPSTINAIGEGAFESCSNISSLSLPDAITVIPNRAFLYCEKLRSINIPSSVTSIGTYAFSGCKELKSITLPEGLVVIGTSAFTNCFELTTISIPTSVTNIEERAFSGCSGLTELILPESITTIKASSFYGCRNLKTITIPSAVEIIYGDAFANCNGLELIIAKPTTPPTTLNSAFSNKDVPVRVPTGCVDVYKADDVWKTFTYLDDQTVHKLRYMVDDQAYKEFDLEYGADIPSVDNPTKDGFIFKGWQYEMNGKTYTYNPEKDDIKMPARDFSFTANFKSVTYSLTYYVDNRYVYSESHVYGDAITPYEYTVPEGYTFSGWTDLPETMPANDLNIYGTTQRDPETIDLTMLVKVIDLIMSSSYSKDYDLNNDGDLNIGDVILIVKQILASSSNNTRGTRASDITDISEFTAAHFILKVPVGSDVSDICLTEGNQKTHRVMFEKKDDQTFAVVVFSLDNARLTSENGTIVKAVTANGSIIPSTIESATFVTPNGEKSIIDPSNGTTAIRTIQGIEKTATIYDLSGRKINATENLKKGVYIINGRKMVVK